MTRDEALGTLPRHYTDKDGNQYIAKCTVEHLVNKIYDGFEARICKNCKYYDKDGMCNGYWYDDETVCSDYSVVPNPEIYVDKDFGCNQFEAKE